jgi:hypothetical protein
MTFFSDLDAPALIAIVVAVVVSLSVSFLYFRDWENHWTIDEEAPGTLIVFLIAVFLVGAGASYSPNEHAPRKTVEGVARFVAVQHGRHTTTVFICATSCVQTGGYALALNEHAAAVTSMASNYRFTYLAHPTGNTFTGTSLKVVGVSDPDSGQLLYAMDLTNHPYRILAYSCDAALLIFTVFLASYLTRNPRREDSGGERSHESPEQSDSISLKLDSRD